MSASVMIVASSAAIPLATKAAMMNCVRSLWLTKTGVLLTQFPSAGRLHSGGLNVSCSGRGKIAFQPIAYDAPHAIIVLRKHEMIDAAEQMQFGRLTRALEHFDRLLGRRHRVVGAVQEQERPRRDLSDDLLGAKIEHALGRLGREHRDRS